MLVVPSNHDYNNEYSEMLAYEQLSPEKKKQLARENEICDMVWAIIWLVSIAIVATIFISALC